MVFPEPSSEDVIFGDESQAYALGYNDNPKTARNAIATRMDPFLNLIILIQSMWKMTLQHNLDPSQTKSDYLLKFPI